MSIQDRNNIQQLQELLKNTAGKSSDLATPIVASEQVQNQEMIVDFGEQRGTLVPLGQEEEDDLIQADYDAYGNVVNW